LENKKKIYAYKMISIGYSTSYVFFILFWFINNGFKI
jgi:hypothetical protein